MKYNDNGEYKDIYIKSLDTLPVGTEVDFDGNSVPSGWEEVANYDTGWNSVTLNTGFTGELYIRKIGNIVQIIGENITGGFNSGIDNFATLPYLPYKQLSIAVRRNENNECYVVNITNTGIIRGLIIPSGATIQFTATYFV